MFIRSLRQWSFPPMIIVLFWPGPAIRERATVVPYRSPVPGQMELWHAKGCHDLPILHNVTIKYTRNDSSTKNSISFNEITKDPSAQMAYPT